MNSPVKAAAPKPVESEAAKAYRPHPTAALRRFNQNLNETSYGKRYLKINLDRVSTFLDKPDGYTFGKQSDTKTESQSSTSVVGLTNNGLKLQELPEFQKEIGYRSRFGDGDGSFFDLWLNADGERSSKQKFDKDGLPLPSKATQKFPQPLTGFKRYYMLKNGSTDVSEEKKFTTMPSYDDRRRARLEREAQEREAEEREKTSSQLPPLGIPSLSPSPPGSPMLGGLTGQRSKTAFDSSSLSSAGSSKAKLTGLAVVGSASVSADGDSGPPKMRGVQVISTVEKDTYFGEDARNTFFDYYRQLSRQQHAFTGRISKDSTEINQRGLSILVDSRVETTALGGGIGVGKSAIDFVSTSTVGSTRREVTEKMVEEKYGKFLEKVKDERTVSKLVGLDSDAKRSIDIDDSTGLLRVDTDADSPSPVQSPGVSPGRSGSRRSFRRQSLLSKKNSAKMSISGKAKMKEGTAEAPVDGSAMFRDFLNDVERSVDVDFLSIPTVPGAVNDVENAYLALASRPLSARTRFLVSCVSSDLYPDPSLILRRDITSTLNITSKSIGNKMASVLASAITTLPMLEELRLADNRLTDEGLKAIIDVLADCPRLASVDISQNKVDLLAATSLATFLSNPKCILTQLLVRNADVDDMEATHFVQALGQRNTVTYLDMSKNLLGSHEVRPERIRNPSQFVTGTQMLGQLISSPDCNLRTLILSWNMIRLSSCVALVQAVKFNESLTHLDLSYNGLSNEGGCALGDALHSQKSLKHLNIAHNNLQSKAAFVILSGVQSCETLKFVDISENPIGEVGGKAVMAAHVALGDAITIKMNGCTLRTKDASCWFDPKKPPKDLKLNLSDPYERAVLVEVLRIIANNEDMKLTKCKYSPDRNSSQDLEFVVRRVLRNAPSSDISAVESAPKTDLDRARRLFRQFDEDGNGTLDRHELSHLLRDLGLVNSKEAIDQMLAIYDCDRAGVIEEAEFVNFLAAMEESATKAQVQSSEIRYLVLKDAAAAMGSTVKAATSTKRRQTTANESSVAEVLRPYIPPSVGTVDYSFTHTNSVSVFLQTATSGNVQSVLNATKALSDSSAMIDCALESMNLKLEEALVLYRIMIKEAGDKFKVLMQLLPRMSNPSDARRLVNKTSSGDLEERIAFRSSAGKLYDVFMRVPVGFYSFNLSDELDRTILHKLIDLHLGYVKERQRLDLADTSERGNWMASFRNVMYENRPLHLTDEWLQDVPHVGRLSLDFVPLNRVATSEHFMSDMRLCNLLIGLGLLAEDQRSHIYSRLRLFDDQGKAASKGLGISACEVSIAEAEESAVYVEQLRDINSSREAAVDMVLSEREIERDAYFTALAAAEAAGKGKKSTKGNGGPAPDEDNHVHAGAV